MQIFLHEFYFRYGTRIEAKILFTVGLKYIDEIAIRSTKQSDSLLRKSIDYR